MTNFDLLKQQVAEHALQYVRTGMVLGIGSGSTARYLVYGLAERLRDGRLRDVVGVATSEATAALCRERGVPLETLAERPHLDLAIDGADEIDPSLDLIKGLGGALLREKIVAASADQFIVIADDSKLVGQLGTRAPLPVEVIEFGLPLAKQRLSDLGCAPEIRRAADGGPFRTDEGNVILDCRFAGIADATVLNAAVNGIPGVVEHGLFINMASVALVSGAGGVTTMVRAKER